MIKSYEDLINLVKQHPQKKRVAVAAAHDFHTLQGIDEAAADGIIEPVLVGDEAKIKALIRVHGLHLEDAQILHQKDDIKAAQKAVELIRQGKAEILMKGKLQTADLMKEVVNKDHGLQTDHIMSHVGLFQIPAYHKLIILTDGGMVIAPDAEQKKKIIENAVKVMWQMGTERPKVAALCATELENPKIQASMDAAELKKWNREGVLKGCIVEGPISFDLMFDKESAGIKNFESPVAGDADIWLVPDMTAGNMTAKALMCAAGAKMAGIIVGAKVPIVLVSRGASSDEKYLSLVFAAAVS